MIRRKNKSSENQSALPMEYPATIDWDKDMIGYFLGLYPILNGSRVIGFDIETTGLNPYVSSSRILTISVSDERKTGQGSIFPLKSIEELYLRKILEDSKVMLVGHNIKFDLQWIEKKLGIRVKCIVFDTGVAQFFIDENKCWKRKFPSLDELIQQANYIDLIDYKKNISVKATEYMNPMDLLARNVKDADASRRLLDYYVPKLKEINLIPLMTVASQATPIIARMETRGLLIDRDWADRQKLNLIGKMLDIRKEMRKVVTLANFDPNSSDDMRNALLDLSILNPFEENKLTTGGKLSTDYETLLNLKKGQDHPFLDLAINYREIQKLKSTYYDPIPEWTQYDGRIHCTLNINGAKTGRLSCSSPNIQAFPRGKEFRGMVIPTPGYIFLEGDYSQIELRIAAWMAQQEDWLEAFENDIDIHSQVMSDLMGIPYEEILAKKDTDIEIKNTRVAIKNYNFALLYGAYEAKLQRMLALLGIHWSLERCKDLKDKWENKNRNIVRWRERVETSILHRKYGIMPLGQRRRLPLASKWNKIGRRQLRQGVNFPVQSMDSWIMICLMILVDKYGQQRQEIDLHQLMQIHDDLLMEVKDLSEYKGMDYPYLEIISGDIQSIAENEVKEFIWDIFKVKIGVKLQFEIKCKERWS